MANPSILTERKIFTENPFSETIELLDDVVIDAPVTAEIWFNGVNQPYIIVTPTVVGQSITIDLTVDQLTELPARNATLNIKFDGIVAIQQKLIPTRFAELPVPPLQLYDTPGSVVYRVSFYSDGSAAQVALDAADAAQAIKDEVDTAIDGIQGLVYTPELNGAAGDGSTNDTTAVNTTFAANKDVTLLNEYLVTSLTNKYGRKTFGAGKILKAITGGFQQLNSYGDDYQYFFGQEYLWFYQNKLLTRSLADTMTGDMFGDSTTAGIGVSGPYYPHILLAMLMRRDSISNLTFNNRGVSGSTTKQWRDTYLQPWIDAGLHDIVILRLGGINDASAGRTVDQFLDDLDNILSRIRADKGVDELSILLMSANSVADTVNNRDERWFESVAGGIQWLARKYQCAYMDTYALYRDARKGLGLWMDNASGGAVHPGDTLNTLIYGAVYDFLVPTAIRMIAGNPGSRNDPSGTTVVTNAMTYDQYPFGHTIFQATTGNGFPVTGIVETTKNHGSTTIQRLVSTLSGQCQEYKRSTYYNGSTTVWTPWLLEVTNLPRTSFPAGATTDADFPTNLGIYDVLSSSTFPVTGILLVYKNRGGGVVQDLTSTTQPRTRRYTRSSYYNGSVTAWTPWEKVTTALYDSFTYSLPVTAVGATNIVTRTVTGATIGDFVKCSMSIDQGAGNAGSGFRLDAFVSATDTVTVVMENKGNLASGTASITLYLSVENHN